MSRTDVPPDTADLAADNARLRARVAELEAERGRVRSAIQSCFFHGADEDAWPPGVHYADALGPFVDRLRARAAELEAERAALLVLLRDRAIDDHRAGLTEPMDDWLDDGSDEPDPATLARAAGLGDGFDETAAGNDPEPEGPGEFARWVLEECPPAPPGPFLPFAIYNRPGDQVEVYLSNANYYGRWLGGGLTVFLEQGTDRVVGLEVGGIKDLIRCGKVRRASRRFDSAPALAGWADDDWGARP